MLLHQKFAFLNGQLQEEIFVEKLEGFIEEFNRYKVYLLKKALYSLKQTLKPIM